VFSAYFQEQSNELKEKLAKRLSTKKLADRRKTLEGCRDLFTFFQDHLPQDIHVGSGRIRGRSHMLPKTIDLIFYNKWCKGLIDMCDAWHLAQYTLGIMSIELELSTQALVNHVNLTQSVKTLYAKSMNLAERDYIPVTSIMFAYDNNIPLLSHQKAIYHAQEEKKIPYNCEIDLVIVLNQGLIMKDWENGNFKVIETGKDTLMWSYVMMMEFMGLDDRVSFNARDYIKTNEVYPEY
jgi:hypothetical protein